MSMTRVITFDESDDDRRAYRSNVSRIVTIIKSMEGDIVGDVITESMLGREERDVFEIRCKLKTTMVALLVNVLSVDYYVEKVSSRFGYKFGWIPSNNTDDSGPDVEAMLRHSMIIMKHNQSRFNESRYSVWIPLRTKGFFRSVSVVVMDCSWETWYTANRFNTVFDIDALCINHNRLFVLCPHVVTTSLSNMIVRVSARKFSVMHPFNNVVITSRPSSRRHIMGDGGVHDMDIVMETRYDKSEKGCGGGQQEDTSEVVNILTSAIRRAVDMVANKDWIMDDLVCGRKSWVVAKWQILLDEPRTVRRDSFASDDLIKISKDETVHALSSSLYYCIFNQVSAAEGTSYLASNYDVPTANDVCPLCHEAFASNDIVLNLACNHNFHACCSTGGASSVGICDWLGTNVTCPYCRAVVQ
jgi:hypothetical protein